MRRFTVAILVAFLLIVAVGPAQQVAAPGPTAPGTVKICSDKNLPPCADPPRAIKSPEPEVFQRGPREEDPGPCRIVAGGKLPDGRARDVRVERSLGYGLDEQAIRTIKKWKFKPATMGGTPVAVEIKIEVNFRLY